MQPVVMLAWAAAITNIVMGIPQVLEVRRTGTSGLSPTSILLWLTCNLAWLSWAAAVGDVPVLVSCGAGAIPVAMVTTRSVADRRMPWWVALTAAAAALTVPIVGGTAAAGWIATALTVAVNVPQVVRTVRSRNFAGVSLGRYVLEGAKLSCWLAYGAAMGLHPLVVTSLLQVPPILLLATLTIRSRRTAATATVGAGQPLG